MEKWKISGCKSLSDEEPILGSQAPEKVLGILWKRERDVLTFDSKHLVEFIATAKPTKRTLMGAAARLYDPTGFLAPFVMQIKLLLQKTHLQKIGLDKTLPKELLGEWEKWCQQLKFINNFEVSRCLTKNIEPRKQEIHAFADASEAAYAAVVYLKSRDGDSGRTIASFVVSKARLSPLKSLKSLTIPKKELVAAMCAARLASTVRKFLNLQCPCFYWTDSLNVYHWIRSQSPLKYDVFVRNRLIEIAKLTSASDWFHVPGSQNPAD